MCLSYCNRITTQEDITCYKIMWLSNEGKLFSPMFPCKWELGWRNTIRTKNLVRFDNEEKSLGPYVYHTYVSLDDTRIAFRWYKSNSRYRTDGVYVICECTIPKDSEYVFRGEVESPFRWMTAYGPEGDRILSVDGYASTTLKITKILEKANHGKVSEN